MKSFVISVAILFLFVAVADAQILRARRVARQKTVVTQKRVVESRLNRPALGGKCRIVNGQRVCGQ